MQIYLPNGKAAWLIGDSHIGRKFEAGVSPHKRGLREARQMRLLRNELHTPNVDFNVSMGDTFDHPHVAYKVALEVAEAYLEAAKDNPLTDYYVIAGNHDLSRNLGALGAFEAFEGIVADRLPNLKVVREFWEVHGLGILLPWQWDVTAEEQLKPYAGLVFSGYVALGHFDLQSYGGDDSHMAPTQTLHDLGITEIYSGHYHTEGDYKVNGHVVHCTGSLEPYSHGEDPEGLIYVTLSLDEALDGRDLTEKCVRVVLKDGEELPQDLDCMALTAIKAKAESEQLDELDTSKFEWKSVLAEALADLDPEVKSFIEERLPA